MLTFPQSSVQEFFHQLNWMPQHERKHLRVGQAFFNYFKCHKVTGKDRAKLDALYERDGNAAIARIRSMTDPAQ
jgi:hypothetical protein